jgi:predicted RNase H-like nuclease (RuvC/YqgF family)
VKKRHTLFGIPFLWMMAYATVVQEGGGGSPAADAPPEEEQKKPEESQGPKAAEPSVFQNLLGAVQGKGNLVAENQSLKKQLEELQGKVTTLEADNARLQGEVSGYQSDMASLEAALKSEEGKTKEVAQAAAEKIVQHGFKGDLPEQKGGGGDTIEALVEQMNKTTDPKEKFRLAGRIEELETKAEVA